MSTGRWSVHSIRRSAPADVSPDNPALIAVIGLPSAADFAAINVENACDGSNPSPAVRLVPKNRTVTFLVVESRESLTLVDAFGGLPTAAESAAVPLAPALPAIFRSG